MLHRILVRRDYAGTFYHKHFVWRELYLYSNMNNILYNLTTWTATLYWKQCSKVLYVKYWKQSSNLKRRHKMQQKLLIYSELMNGKYHTLSDIVLQKLCNNLLDLSTCMVMGPDFKRESRREFLISWKRLLAPHKEFDPWKGLHMIQRRPDGHWMRWTTEETECAWTLASKLFDWMILLLA